MRPAKVSLLIWGFLPFWATNFWMKSRIRQNEYDINILGEFLLDLLKKYRVDCIFVDLISREG